MLILPAAGWLTTTAAYLLLLAVPGRKRMAAIRLAENLVSWLFLLLVLLFVYYSAGSAYTDHASILVQSAFMAMGFAFVSVSAPLLLLRILRTRIDLGQSGR